MGLGVGVSFLLKVVGNFVARLNLPAVVALAWITAGCSSPPPIASTPGVVELSTGALPVPEAYREKPQGTHYVIGPFDKLLIDVFGIEDLSREALVDAGGNISFPIAGNIAASGMTTAELAQTIEERLRKFVRDPIVSVNTTEIRSPVITVDGEVEKPDRYVAMGRLTLERAVAMAGGLTDDAGSEEVVVFRDIGTARYAGVFDLEAIRRGNYPDPVVYPGDVVIVGDAANRELTNQLIDIAPLLTPIILLLRQ